MPVSVATLYGPDTPLRQWLTRYKGREDGSEPIDEACQPIVRALLGRMLLRRSDHLASRGDDFDAIEIVPSRQRQPPHPLTALLASLRPSVPLTALLSRGPGELNFGQPSVDGFIASPVTTGARRVLVADDVYTTGARAQSAAHALSVAGHEVIGICVLARRVNPTYDKRAQALWDQQSARLYHWASSPAIV